MLTYCFKCKKNTEDVNPKMIKRKNGTKQCYHKNVLYVVMKNQDLWKNKKQKDY